MTPVKYNGKIWKSNEGKGGMKMEKNILKICSFYVSDWHLTAMLLPFIEEQVEKGENLNTILQKNIVYNMKEILSRIKINEKTKTEIIDVDWKSKNLLKYGEVKKFMEKITKNHRTTTIIIEGNKDRIEFVNKNIDKWIQKRENKLFRKQIRIINCYEVNEFNENLQEILDEHDKILNTSGIHEIEEMYNGYIKKGA